MNEFVFTWQMTRKMAKKLVRKQFYKYSFVQYFIKWFLFCESFFWILVFFDFNIYTLLLSVLICIGILIILYTYYYFTMIPASPYMTDYSAGFGNTVFWVDGKNYRRQYAYDQIDHMIVKNDYLIFLTKYEGIIIPTDVFSTPKERLTFINWIKLKLK